jgi:hypothetical protein
MTLLLAPRGIGVARFGEEEDGGRPLVKEAGNPRLAGVPPINAF